MELLGEYRCDEASELHALDLLPIDAVRERRQKHHGYVLEVLEMVVVLDVDREVA